MGLVETKSVKCSFLYFSLLFDSALATFHPQNHFVVKLRGEKYVAGQRASCYFLDSHYN